MRFENLSENLSETVSLFVHHCNWFMKWSTTTFMKILHESGYISCMEMGISGAGSIKITELGFY